MTCFVEGTPVLAAEGLVPIEAVSAGDIVWAEDPESGEQSLSSVVQTFENETEVLVHVTVEGDTITSTPHHPFYSPVKGWTDAADLRAGDILVRSNGEYVIVEQVQHEILESPVKVYNFEVQEYHTYYVGCREVLVHNMCTPKGGYNPPKGGGGVTNFVKVGETKVTFGHGGRHLEGTGLNIQEVNNAIANDVVNKNMEVGKFLKTRLIIQGKVIEYTSFRLGQNHVNIGTYYPK